MFVSVKRFIRTAGAVTAVMLSALVVFGVLGLNCMALMTEPGTARSSTPRPNSRVIIRNTGHEHLWYATALPLQEGVTSHGTESWYNLAPGAEYRGMTIFATGDNEVYFTVNTTGRTTHEQRINRVESFRSWPKKTFSVTIEQLQNNETITVEIP